MSLAGFNVHHLPNIISVLRILLVAPTVWALLQLRFELALILFLIAGISDGVDGFLAKQFNWESRLGSILDPLADKLLLLACYITLYALGLLPWWLVGLVLLRDLIIVVGATLYHYLIDSFTGEPTLVSKINTVAQILLVLMVLLGQVLPQVKPGWITLLMGIIAGTTLVSGADYIVTWGRRVRQHAAK